jgi:VWFA-related protein
MLIGCLAGLAPGSPSYHFTKRQPQNPPGGQLVRINVSVWDGDGKPVTDLSEQDFAILEQGEQQKITGFLKATAPLRILILVDTSESMTNAFGRIREALVDFVSWLGLHDEVALVSFTRDPLLEVDFSVNRERIKDGLHKLQLTRERYEVTHVYDALEPVLDHLHEAGKNMRTAVILATDGIDRGSYQFTEKTSLKLAAQSRVPFYLIQAQGRERQYLKDLADVTAGRFYVADKFLEKNLQELAQHLGAHYVLEFTSSNSRSDKKLLNFEVKVARPGVKLVAPASYRMPPGP